MAEYIEVGKFRVNVAKIKHSARQTSMKDALDIYLSRLSEKSDVDKNILQNLKDKPEIYETMSDEQREYCDIAKSLGSWVYVACCIEPFITMSQWLDLSSDELGNLTNAVMELNPHWFDTPEQEKKIEEIPISSTENSQN